MPQNWKETLGELQAFISANKEIEITADAVCLPDSVRPDFYRLFDRIRLEFVKDNFQLQLAEAVELVNAYGDISRRVCAFLGVSEIEINQWLSWFFSDPAGCLSRILFDPLFEVLKGKAGAEAFEAHSRAAVSELHKNLFRLGYDRWCTLAIITALAPSGAYTVPIADHTTEPGLTDGELVPGNQESVMPDVELATKLPLNHTPVVALLTPKVILQLPGSGCYAGLRTDYHEVYRRERSLKEAPRWVKTAELKKDFGSNDLWPDLGVYLGSNPQDVALIADYFSIILPDITVEYMENEDWHARGGVQSAIRHFLVAKPRLGGFIICRKPLPEDVMLALVPPPALEAGKETQGTVTPERSQPPKQHIPSLPPLPDGLRVIVAGYDATTLKPIAAAIKSACSQT